VALRKSAHLARHRFALFAAGKLRPHALFRSAEEQFRGVVKRAELRIIGEPVYGAVGVCGLLDLADRGD
jgi:hypothetical protein